MSPNDKLRRVDSLYVGPAGSSLGTGRILNDGTIDRIQPLLRDQIFISRPTSSLNKINLNED